MAQHLVALPYFYTNFFGPPFSGPIQKARCNGQPVFSPTQFSMLNAPPLGRVSKQLDSCHSDAYPIDARYRLVLKDTDISSRRTKIRYQYRYQSYRFLKSISIQIPILTIFKKDINTNTNTDHIQKGYQYQYQYLIFSKTISIPIPIPHIFKSTNIAAVPELPEKHVWHLAKHVFGNCGGAYQYWLCRILELIKSFKGETIEFSFTMLIVGIGNFIVLLPFWYLIPSILLPYTCANYFNINNNTFYFLIQYQYQYQYLKI